MRKYFDDFIKILLVFIIFSRSASIMCSVSSNYVTSAFNELVVVEPMLTSEIKFTYNIPSNDVRTTTTGTGSVTATGGVALVQTGTGSTGAANVRNKYRTAYRPGQGSVGMITAIFSSGAANSTQFVGVGNAEDGFLFGYSGTQFGILYRTNTSGSVVNNWIPQSSWNFDTMNGTGPSGAVLNPLKGNVYKVQYQWLGFGNIKFYIEDTSGTINLVHIIQYPNQFTGTSIRNPSLQTFADVANSGNTGNISISVPCMASFTEGTAMPRYYARYSLNLSKTTSNSATTTTSVIGIQNQATFPGTTRTNQVLVYPQVLSVFNVNGGANDFVVRVYLNPTVTSSSYTNTINTNSAVLYDTAGTTVSGGTILATFFTAASTGDIYVDLSSLNIALAPSDVLVIGIQNNGASAVTARASLSWIEGL